MTIKRLHIYTHTIPIRWRDVDPYGVVNHSVFFTYMEEARWHWYYHLALKKEISIITPIVDAQITFKKPLTYPGTAIIKIYAEPPNKNNWNIYHEIYSEKDTNALCAESLIKFVSCNPDTNQVVSIPEELRSHLYPDSK